MSDVKSRVVYSCIMRGVLDGLGVDCSIRGSFGDSFFYLSTPAGVCSVGFSGDRIFAGLAGFDQVKFDLDDPEIIDNVVNYINLIHRR